MEHLQMFCKRDKGSGEHEVWDHVLARGIGLSVRVGLLGEVLLDKVLEVQVADMLPEVPKVLGVFWC